MKILLTGAQGNLGSHIVKHCTHEIVPLFREDWPIIGDLLQGVDIVVHAAYDLKSKLFEHPHSVLDSNLMSTIRLLETMKKHQTARLIFISTCAVYVKALKR